MRTEDQIWINHRLRPLPEGPTLVPAAVKPPPPNPIEIAAMITVGLFVVATAFASGVLVGGAL